MAALCVGCTVFDGLQATAAEAGASSSGGGAAATTSSASGSGGGVGGGSGGVGGEGGGAGGAGGAGGGGGSAACDAPGQRGSPMVEVKTSANAKAYCIDANEVTRGQYQAFLNEDPEPNQPPPCDGNPGFTPAGIEWPPKNKDKLRPVSGVDQCDALAYCAWAGKRLCGAIGGGGTNLNGSGDPATSQWLNACSNGGARSYPYGDSYEPKTCNGSDYSAGGPLNVQQASGCEGAVSGLFDMSGNVREWEDACDGNDCSVRGGSYESSDSGELSCGSSGTLDRFETDPTTGFRCCK